jgi:iron(III) transport system permease protein
MFLVRWFGILARCVLTVAVVGPVVALPLAVLFDRGPAGETRTAPHLFPLALWLFDDFAWTCARNSVIFAILVSCAALVIGGALGWLAVRRRFLGQRILRGLVLALLVVSPAFLALGLLGLWGSPGPWPWPFAGGDGVARGVSLESWRGLPLWVAWVWTTLPAAVALVAQATTRSVAQLEPSWEDAARLTGVGSLRAWKTLSWPLVRPASARAAALVFLFALVEPGAPLLLGLRRTLAFQIIQAASRPEPFPHAAVWAVMTGLFGLIGWAVWRWTGGPPLLGDPLNAMAAHRAPRLARTATPLAAFASTTLLAGWAILSWLPLIGLVQLVLGQRGDEPSLAAGSAPAVFELSRMFSDPPVPRLLANSLILGLEVGGATLAIVWLIGPRLIPAAAPKLRRGPGQAIALLPPLVQGVGVLALPWLAGLGAALLIDLDRGRPLANALGAISLDLDPVHHAWPLLSCAVGLALVPRLLLCWQGEAAVEPAPRNSPSAMDAALLAGASRARGRRLSTRFAVSRWFGRFVLASALAATNLTPALLFEPWADGQTLAPAIVVMAGEPADAQSRAAALALCAIGVNLVALAVARLTSLRRGRADLE